MNIKTIIDEISVGSQCRKYGLSLWQCPQFLFLVMGIVIIVATITAYFVGNRYIEDPLKRSITIADKISSDGCYNNNYAHH